MRGLMVTFACGHRLALPRKVPVSPLCPCGERVIVHVEAPPPVIRGTAKGPHVETVALPPMAVSLGGSDDGTP